MPAFEGEFLARLAGDAFDQVHRHLRFAPSYRGGLFLIWGGLVLIGLLSAFAVVSELLPGRRRAATSLHARLAERRTRRVAPVLAGTGNRTEAAQGRGALPLGTPGAADGPGRAFDAALTRLVEEGVGVPRVLDTESGLKRIRIDACAACAARAVASGARCERPRVALAHALSSAAGFPVDVHEVACRARGDEACVFEVAY